MMTSLMLNPFREMLSLREAMDRLFDESFVRNGSFGGSLGMAVDVEAKPAEFIVRANVPGLKPEDLHVEIMDNSVTMRGEIKGENRSEKGNYLLMERHHGQFSRTIALPAPVVASKAEAVIENGVLTLRLPKADEAKPKAITVKAK